MDKLRYNIDKWDEFEIIDFYPDLCMIGEWAEDIREEWESTHPDYIPFELEKFGTTDKYSKASAMPTPLSVAYKILIEGICPDEIRASLSKFVDVMAYLSKDIEQYQRDQQGSLYGVPKKLQSDEAEATKEPGEATLPEELASNELAMELLKKCKEAGLLDENFMPIPREPGKTGTTGWQKKEMAKNIRWLCDIKTLHEWEPFKTFWESPYIDKAKTPDLSKPEFNNKGFLKRKETVDNIFAPYIKQKNKDISKNHDKL